METTNNGIDKDWEDWCNLLDDDPDAWWKTLEAELGVEPFGTDWEEDL